MSELLEIDLPASYPHHAHSSAEARAIARDGLILLTEVGSGVHGTSVDGTDDRDLMGICVPPPEYVLGLSRVPAGQPDAKTAQDTEELIKRRGGRWIDFEQYERHTAWDRAGGLRERSGAGDVDVLIYDARKWAQLAVGGNPTVLLPLFAPQQSVEHSTVHAEWLRENAWRFATKHSIARFLGYLLGQKSAMVGERPARTNRPELVAKYGYDTKFGAHAVRLGFQGIQFATERRISLPMEEPHLSMVREVRNGEPGLEEVLALIDVLAGSLTTLLKESDLPERVDIGPISDWLIRTYKVAWRISGGPVR